MILGHFPVSPDQHIGHIADSSIGPFSVLQTARFLSGNCMNFGYIALLRKIHYFIYQQAIPPRELSMRNKDS
jgi:hypothetical protein